MRLYNHIAYRLLTDDSLTTEIVMHTFPDYNGSETDPIHKKVISLIQLINKRNQKAFFITNTVIDKLELLLTKRNSDGYFDWTVFKNLKDEKSTFIFPDGKVLRMEIVGSVICFAHFEVKRMYDDIRGELGWVLFYLDRFTGALSENFFEHDVQQLDDFIYRLLCFLYLTENDELVLNAGQKHGTKKNGKIINDLPVPITIVNSRWNTAVIRTDKFGVRGHFAIRWTGQGRSSAKLVFINPFTKNGYKRTAASINHKA